MEDEKFKEEFMAQIKELQKKMGSSDFYDVFTFLHQYENLKWAATYNWKGVVHHEVKDVLRKLDSLALEKGKTIAEVLKDNGMNRALLEAKLEEAKKALEEVEKIAKENCLSFSIEVGGYDTEFTPDKGWYSSSRHC